MSIYSSDSEYDGFPDRVMINIFTFLHPKMLLRCRSVCSSWKEIIDELNEAEILWCRNCRKDFPDICDAAYFKSRPTLNWYRLYRSLSIWSKLPQAHEHIDQFSPAKHPQEAILNFQVLRNSVMGIHKRQGITYYDYNAIRAYRRKIDFFCDEYSENEHIVALYSYDQGLHVIQKESWNSTIGHCVRLRNVKSCLSIDNVVYFVKEGESGDDIFSTKESNGEFAIVTLVNVPEGVMELGHKNGLLYILGNTLNIYILVGNELRTVWNFEVGKKCRELLSMNFLETLVWKDYYRKITQLTQIESVYELSDITKIRVYGNIVFVGTSEGVLRIYKSQSTDDIFDILRSTPIKEYDLMGAFDRLKIIRCTILQIDVVEGVDSHKVLVGLPRKIIYINFKHNFTGTSELLVDVASGSRQR